MITKTIDIELTPQELAKEFANFTSNEQAEFFSLLSGFFDELGLRNQLASVERSRQLTDQGREVMKTIGLFSEKVIKTSYKNWTVDMVRALPYYKKSGKDIATPEEVLAEVERLDLPFGDEVDEKDIISAIVMLTPF